MITCPFQTDLLLSLFVLMIEGAVCIDKLGALCHSSAGQVEDGGGAASSPNGHARICDLAQDEHFLGGEKIVDNGATTFDIRWFYALQVPPASLV